MSENLAIIAQEDNVTFAHHTCNLRVVDLNFDTIWVYVETITSDFNFFACLEKLSLRILKRTISNCTTA